MKRIVLGVCLLAAACSDGLQSPTSPSAAVTPAAGQLPGGSSLPEARRGSALPFKGSYNFNTSGSFNCPPTCPPTVLTVRGEGEGTATHLGQFTLSTLDVVDMASTASTGTFDLTAANGDRVVAKTVGKEDQFVPPNISHVTLQATITGGTGRFAHASGSFTIRYVGEIDFAAGTSTGSGSFDGEIDLRE